MGGEKKFAGMREGAVFPEKKALPRSEEEAPINDGKGFAGPCEGHFNVAWHIIRTLLGVREVAVVLGDEAVHPAGEIPPCGGVGVFHEDQAAACVPAEDMDQPGAHGGFAEKIGDTVGHFKRPFSTRGNADAILVNNHGAKTITFAG